MVPVRAGHRCCALIYGTYVCDGFDVVRWSLVRHRSTVVTGNAVASTAVQYEKLLHLDY